jgi:hypothetical protein
MKNWPNERFDPADRRHDPLKKKYKNRTNPKRAESREADVKIVDANPEPKRNPGCTQVLPARELFRSNQWRTCSIVRSAWIIVPAWSKGIDTVVFRA